MEGEPPSKQSRWEVEEASEIDETAYKDAIKDLEEAMKKKGKGKYKEIKEIMDNTRVLCCWLIQEGPLIADVLLKFPCLALSKLIHANCT